jgi:hypothetical protein
LLHVLARQLLYIGGAWPSGHSVARRLAGDGTTGRGVHGESISGLTEARAAMWRTSDGGEEAAVAALGAGGAWTRREEKESGERCGGGLRVLPLYRNRGADVNGDETVHV